MFASLERLFELIKHCPGFGRRVPDQIANARRREDGGVVMTFHVPAHPGASSEQVSARMSTLRRRDNSAELAVRRLLHAAGHRYRVAYPVPSARRRTIDIAFTRAKVAVFIDGCSWHGCPQHGTRPRSNADWWSAKLAANRARDLDTSERLAESGWAVLRIWEHEAPGVAAARVEVAVRAARAALTGREQEGSRRLGSVGRDQRA